MSRHAWRPFEEAREYARGLGLDGYRAWRDHVRAGGLPGDVPALPDNAYRAAWQGWPDFLGHTPGAQRPRRRVQWMTLEEAMGYARTLPLPRRSMRGWYDYHRRHARPATIPADPSGVYPDFPGWPEFLGLGQPQAQPETSAPTPPTVDVPGPLPGGRELCAALSTFTRGREPFALAAVVWRASVPEAQRRGAFARALHPPAPGDAHVFHLEGELFAVVLAGEDAVRHPRDLARGLRDRLVQAQGARARDTQVAVAVFPQDAVTPETLLRAARGRLRGEAADRVVTPCPVLLGLPQDREDVVRAGPLRLHPHDRRAFLDGVELQFTRGEFAVALALARRPGQPVSRQELAEASRRDAATAEGALNIHITNMRAKLAGAGHPELIRTVRGVGYALWTPPE